MSKMYTQEEVDRIVRDEVDKKVKEAVDKERARAAAVASAYKALQDARDEALLEMRSQLSPALDMLNDKSKELDTIRCELLHKALKQRLCVPTSCALESVLKPAFFF